MASTMSGGHWQAVAATTPTAYRGVDQQELRGLDAYWRAAREDLQISREVHETLGGTIGYDVRLFAFLVPDALMVRVTTTSDVVAKPHDALALQHTETGVVIAVSGELTWHTVKASKTR